MQSYSTEFIPKRGRIVKDEIDDLQALCRLYFRGYFDSKEVMERIKVQMSTIVDYLDIEQELCNKKYLRDKGKDV